MIEALHAHRNKADGRGRDRNAAVGGLLLRHQASFEEGQAVTLSVGQKLWFAPRDLREAPHEVTVVATETHRQEWVRVSGPTEYSSDLLLNVQTLQTDGGRILQPGRCYLTKAEHDRVLELRAAWDGFRDLLMLNGNPPAHLSIEDIAELRAMVEGQQQEVRRAART